MNQDYDNLLQQPGQLIVVAEEDKAHHQTMWEVDGLFGYGSGWWMRSKMKMDESQKDQTDSQNDHFSLVSTHTQVAHLGHKTPNFANCKSANC